MTLRRNTAYKEFSPYKMNVVIYAEYKKDRFFDATTNCTNLLDWIKIFSIVISLTLKGEQLSIT